MGFSENTAVIEIPHSMIGKIFSTIGVLAFALPKHLFTILVGG